MASPTASVVRFAPTNGFNQISQAVLDLAWTTYAQSGADKLVLTGLVLPGLDPTKIVAVNGVAPTGQVVVFTPNASATLADAGGLSLFAGTTQTSAGAFAQTVRVVVQFYA